MNSDVVSVTQRLIDFSLNQDNILGMIDGYNATRLCEHHDVQAARLALDDVVTQLSLKSYGPVDSLVIKVKRAVGVLTKAVLSDMTIKVKHDQKYRVSMLHIMKSLGIHLIEIDTEIENTRSAIINEIGMITASISKAKDALIKYMSYISISIASDCTEVIHDSTHKICERLSILVND